MNLFDIWFIAILISLAVNFILVALLFVKVFEKKELQEKVYKNNDDFLKVINTLKKEHDREEEEQRKWIQNIQIQKDNRRDY